MITVSAPSVTSPGSGAVTLPDAGSGAAPSVAVVKARMDLQVILYDENRHFEFVIGAAALY